MQISNGFSYQQGLGRGPLAGPRQPAGQPPAPRLSTGVSAGSAPVGLPSNPAPRPSGGAVPADSAYRAARLALRAR